MQQKKEILGKIFFILSIVFLGYVLVTPLNHLVCNIDEYFTMTVINLPVWDIITVTAGDVHPPLYYLMAKVVAVMSNAFNLNLLFNLKLLSVLAFVLILIISATEIRKEYGWLTAGLFAFSLSVMSEFSIYHLIARMYAWTVLFIIVAFLAFANIINGKDVKKSWIILTLFSVLAAYCHYYGAITAICIYLILLAYLIKDRKNQIKNWLMSVAAGIILYLPWIFVVIIQLKNIGDTFDYPFTWKEFVKYLGYFAYDETVIVPIISIAFLIIILAIYLKESESFSKNDKTNISAAIGAYFLIIFFSIAFSELFHPILDGRYFLPAAALLWLAVSIILGKIENRRSFLIAMTLIAILLASGVVYTSFIFDSTSHQGQLEREYFDNISQDENSIFIIGTKEDLMFYLCCSEGVDTYCINVSEVCGLPSEELHRQYDYKDINESQIDELISNNTDKNIYFIYWENTLVKSSIESDFTHYNLHYTKISTTNVTK